MSTVHSLQPHGEHSGMEHPEQANSYLTVWVAGQRFGIPILLIQDVLGPQKITRIPLSPPEISGALNLRGRIVTAINLRTRLNAGGSTDSHENKNMSVVVEHKNELYSLIIDKVGDVMSLTRDQYEKALPTMDSAWRDVSAGIYRLEKELLIILDIPKLIETVQI